MKTCTTRGSWVIFDEPGGTITGRHSHRPSHWTIEPQEDGEVRLTVHPDATTYGWLMFRSREEALRFVTQALKKRRHQNSTLVARQIAQWLAGAASRS